MRHDIVPACDFKDTVSALYRLSFGRDFDGVMLLGDQLWRHYRDDGTCVAWLVARDRGHDIYVAYGGVIPGFEGHGARGFRKFIEISARERPGVGVSIITGWDNDKMQILALKLGFKFYACLPGASGKCEVQWARRL